MNEERRAYNDIINLPHHTSAKHPRMSREQRAAQFSPFAALTGHDEAIHQAELHAREVGPDAPVDQSEFEAC